MPSNPAQELWLVQHCESEHHVSDLTGGWTDTPLTPRGVRQAEATAHRLVRDLAGSTPTLYSSDLLRASQTADVVGPALGVDVRIEPDLRERNYGAATGMTKGWERENASPRSGRGADLDRRPFDGAETSREFFGRVTDCVDRLRASATDPLVLVTHGGVVRAVVGWWLEMTPEQYDVTTFGTRAGSITTLRTDGWDRRVLAVLGDVTHLATIADVRGAADG